MSRRYYNPWSKWDYIALVIIIAVICLLAFHHQPTPPLQEITP